MEINKPDIGCFKGMATQPQTFTHKQNFPQVDNHHQFNLDHPKPATFQSISMLTYKPHHQAPYQKRTVNSNASNIVFGQDKPTNKSVTQDNYQKYEHNEVARSSKRQQKPLVLGDTKIEYVSTTKDMHQIKDLQAHKNINYKLNYDKVDTITGIPKSKDTLRNTNNYEFFNPLRDKKYIANNFTLMPTKGQHFDIITGRNIPY